MKFTFCLFWVACVFFCLASAQEVMEETVPVLEVNDDQKVDETLSQEKEVEEINLEILEKEEIVKEILSQEKEIIDEVLGQEVEKEVVEETLDQEVDTEEKIEEKQVEAKEEKSLSPEEEKKEKLRIFTEWLDANQSQRTFDMEMIEGQGAGGVASRNLTEDDYLLRVPLSLLVFKNDVEEIDGWSEWKGVIEPLMIWILREQLNEDSFYKPYLDILPESFEEHPLMWSQEEREYIKGTQLEFSYNRSSSILKGSYDYLVENLFTPKRELFPEEQFTFEKYLWAYLSVSTRSWSVRLPGGEEEYALIPLADMLNHKNSGGQGGLDWQGEYFVINSTQSYSTGEQVYDSYGPKSNFQLLSTYGFVLDENENETVEMAFALDETSPGFVAAKEKLEELDPSYETIYLSNSSPPYTYLRMFRLALLPPSLYHKITDVVSLKGVHLDLEAAAIKYAHRSLRSLRDEGTAVLNQLLAKENRTDIENVIVKFRQGEIEIFEANIISLELLWKQTFFSNKLVGGMLL